MAKKKVTKRNPAVEQEETVEKVKRVDPDCLITVTASYPDGKVASYEYVMKNVYSNHPPAKLLRMGKAVLNGLQEIYGMGVKFK